LAHLQDTQQRRRGVPGLGQVLDSLRLSGYHRGAGRHLLVVAAALHAHQVPFGPMDRPICSVCQCLDIRRNPPSDIGQTAGADRSLLAPGQGQTTERRPIFDDKFVIPQSNRCTALYDPSLVEVE